MGADQDIHFHMSIRFHQNCIVRNTCQGSRWGKEERAGGMPLTKGQNFQMLIAVHQNCFKVYIIAAIYLYMPRFLRGYDQRPV